MTTGDDCIQAADDAIAELALLMQRDPAHGVLYQQRMAVMMFRRMQAMERRDAQGCETVP